MPLLIQQDPGIARKRKLANAMQAQSQQYRPIQNPMQGIGQLAQALSGAYQNKQLDLQEDQRKTKIGDIFSKGITQGQAWEKPWTDPDTGTVTGDKPDISRLINVLAGSPETADAAMQMQMKQMGVGDQGPSDVQTAEWYLKASPEQKAAFDATKPQQKWLNRGDVYTNPRTMKSLGIGVKPSDQPAVVGAKEAAKQAAVIEAIPEKIKAEGKVTDVAKKKTAQTRISGTLSDVASYYRDLNDVGSAINVGNSSLSNLLTSIATSGIGQALQTTLGTEAQSIRNKIKASKPLMINYIRQASEMGARGMDSEKELQFYLQAATNEKRDIQSNLAALKALDVAYGLGLGDFNVDPSVEGNLRSEYKKNNKTSPVDDEFDRLMSQ